MHRSALALTLTLLLAGSLTACSPKSGDSDYTFDHLLKEAKDNASPRQLEILEDRVLTTAELDESAQALYTCFESKDIQYTVAGVNPVDGWTPFYEVNLMNETEVNECSRLHFDYVQTGWPMVNKEVMDPELMTAIQECLRSQNLPVTGSERNLLDLVPEGTIESPRFQKVQECSIPLGPKFPNMGWAF